jgi:hypothetical protein
MKKLIDEVTLIMGFLIAISAWLMSVDRPTKHNLWRAVIASLSL